MSLNEPKWAKTTQKQPELHIPARIPQNYSEIYLFLEIKFFQNKNCQSVSVRKQMFQSANIRNLFRVPRVKLGKKNPQIFTNYQMLCELFDTGKLQLFTLCNLLCIFLFCMCNLLRKNTFKKHMVATIFPIIFLFCDYFSTLPYQMNSTIKYSPYHIYLFLKRAAKESYGCFNFWGNPFICFIYKWKYSKN